MKSILIGFLSPPTHFQHFCCVPEKCLLLPPFSPIQVSMDLERLCSQDFNDFTSSQSNESYRSNLSKDQLTNQLTDRSREPFPVQPIIRSTLVRCIPSPQYRQSGRIMDSTACALRNYPKEPFGATRSHHDRATSSKTCEHNVEIDYIIVGINICAVVILSCCLFSLIGRYICRLRRRYNYNAVLRILVTKENWIWIRILLIKFLINHIMYGGVLTSF